MEEFGSLLLPTCYYCLSPIFKTSEPVVLSSSKPLSLFQLGFGISKSDYCYALQVETTKDHCT
jgi:hypothetical protein